MNLDKHDRHQLALNFRPASNTNLIISNYLETQQQARHKYFVTQANRPSVFGLNIIQSNLQTKPPTPKSSDNLHSTRSNQINEHPILNNGFLKPKAIPKSANNMTEYFNGSSSSISTQKTSMNTTRFKSANTPMQNVCNTSANKVALEDARIEKLLGSKNARDAFFERLRVTEYLNQTKNLLDQPRPNTRLGSGSSSKSSDAMARVYDLKKMNFIASYTDNLLDTDSLSNSSNSGNAINQLNNPNLQVSSTLNLFSKPYSAKTNFSNVTMIDKKSKKTENSVDHAYFYQNTNKANANNQIYKDYGSNVVESGQISLSSFVTEKSCQQSLDNKGDLKTTASKEERPVADPDPVSRSQMHRERINSILNRRNIECASEYAQNCSVNSAQNTIKLDAVYDTKNRVIQLKPAAQIVESAVVSTEATIPEVKPTEIVKTNDSGSGTSSASSIMSSEYSANGFSSSKNSNSNNLAEKLKISAYIDKGMISPKRTLT